MHPLLMALRRCFAAAMVASFIAPAWAAQPESSPGPLTLRAAVAEALAHSPALDESERVLLAANVQHEAAEAAFGIRLTPTLSGGLETLGLVRQGIGLGVAKRLTTGAELALDASSFRYGAEVGDQRDVGFSFRVTQPLLNGFGRVAKAEAEHATRNVDSARRGIDSARQHLVLSAAQAFFSVARLQRTLAASAQAQARARLLQESTAARAGAGLATELDVMRARLLASTAAATAARDAESLDSARDELCRLLGRELDAELVVDDRIAPAEDHHVNLDSLILEARGRRLEVLDARARVAGEVRAAEVARWQTLPPVSLDVGYARRNGWYGNVPLPHVNGGWYVSIVSGAGVGYGAARATQRHAALAVAAAERRVRDVEDRVAIEVRAAARAVSRTAASITLADETIAIARRQRELVELRYQRGLATSLDIVEAEGMLFQAETAVIGARIDHELARLSLQHAAGTLDPAGWKP